MRIEVTIQDINDNKPSFQPQFIQRRISEAAALGTFVQLPSASDIDSLPYSIASYRLASSIPPQHPFYLRWTNDSSEFRSSRGHDLRLELILSLDREKCSRYSFNITASDSLSIAVLSVEVIVEDVNDNSPVFERASYDAVIQRNIQADVPIVTLTATDSDEGINAEVRYSFSRRTQTVSGNLFKIDYVTGDVSMMTGFDMSELLSQPVYSLVVMATDLGANSLPSSVTLTLHVSATTSDSGVDRFRNLYLAIETVNGRNMSAVVVENSPPG